jgi:hypothetical protein
MKLNKLKKRTAEPQNIECRMSKEGIAALGLFKKNDYTNPMHYAWQAGIRFFILVGAASSRDNLFLFLY